MSLPLPDTADPPTLATFGETMLRLSPPDGERLEGTDDLAVRVGGAESNVAATAARLGCATEWRSMLPDSPLARRVERGVREHGVEPVVTRGEGRVGTYYFEPGGAPRGANVIYDRAGAAIRSATPDSLGVETLDHDAVYTSGITPALSETLAETTATMLAAAGEAGAERVLDLNYRAKLWSPTTAAATLRPLFEDVDTLVVAARDAATVLDRDGDPEVVARDLATAHDFDTVVVTRGEDGALALDEDVVYERTGYPADTVDPVGTGDAFVGGFLATLLAGGGVADALDAGTATAALKRTLKGDVAAITPAEVRAVVDADGIAIDR